MTERSSRGRSNNNASTVPVDVLVRALGGSSPAPLLEKMRDRLGLAIGRAYDNLDAAYAPVDMPLYSALVDVDLGSSKGDDEMTTVFTMCREYARRGASRRASRTPQRSGVLAVLRVVFRGRRVSGKSVTAGAYACAADGTLRLDGGLSAASTAPAIRRYFARFPVAANEQAAAHKRCYTDCRRAAVKLAPELLRRFLGSAATAVDSRRTSSNASITSTPRSTSRSTSNGKSYIPKGHGQTLIKQSRVATATIRTKIRQSGWRGGE